MSFFSRRMNLSSLRKHRSGKTLSPKLRRRMLLESLEGRAMMAADVGGDHNDWSTQINSFSPDAEYVTSPVGYLSGPAQGAKVDIAVNYLKSNAASFGATAADFNANRFRVTSSYVTQHNGLTHVYLQQTFNGLPIEGAVANVSLSASGQVLTAASSFLTNLPHPSSPGPITHAFEATQALQTFATTSGYSAEGAWTSVNVNANVRGRDTILNVGSSESLQVKARMHYVATSASSVELAWQLTHLYTFDGEHAYDVSISLDTNSANYNKVIRVADWVDHASYSGFPLPADSPNDIPQTVIVDPQNPNASPFGWHDLNGQPGPETTNTTGNNVFAQEDADDNDTGGVQPNGGAGLNFNFPFDPAAAPATYVNAAIVNLFYVTNVMHDVFWHYGFDEVAGNFQETNYTNQGLEGDAVRADAQDGSGTNNANMLTPPDGTAPRLQQYIWTNPNPDRDSSLDNGIVIHEYTHGISNRLTGGPADANALDDIQSGGMGEGWSDFFAIWMTQTAAHTPASPRPIAAYSDGVAGGIRRYPYSVDMSVNPLTLDDYNGFDPTTGIPNWEVHFAGEIWTSALYDLNWAMINKYGFSSDLYTGTAGNNLAMQLIMDGMKLQPANPTFLEARDAIIAADIANNGGANYMDIWRAFARRGFGYSADDGGDANSTVVIEAFDLPPAPAQVSGVVYLDSNLNANRDAGEFPLSGITVYADANNNRVFDNNEQSSVSGADGSYVLSVAPGVSTVIVRQSIDPLLYQQTEPTNNGGYTVNVAAGNVYGGFDFGNKPQPGEIIGRKWNDLNGDGIQDPGEPGMGGVYIYVDYNNNNKIGILEPAAVTDAGGNFRITNVTPGIWNVREVAAPGSTVTFPLGDPANGLPAGAHYGVVVRSSETTPLIDFGNVTAIDWGDAPNTYGTLASSNGARHSILAGFGLGPAGLVVEHDPDGQPSATASTDTLDDGVRPLTSFTPGELARIAVRATTGGRAAGYLQGWIDFDQDGVFEPSEKVVSDLRLAGSTLETQIEFRVPENAQLGATFARFRYGYETGDRSSPVGPASIGEVEDYLFDFRSEDPVAVIDGPFVVKQDTNGATNPANQFDILFNDIGSTADNGAPPRFGGFVLANGTVVGADTPVTTVNNGTIVFNSTTQRVEYTPEPGFIGNDEFTYFVVDSAGTESDPVRNDIIVAPTDPLPLDDTYRVNPNSVFPVGNGPSPNRFDVLANDIPPTGIFIHPTIRNLDGTPANVNVIRRSADFQTIEYQPPAGFQGTQQYIYTITDNDPLTSDRSAVLTVQVSPAVPTSPPYLVELGLRIFDEDGLEVLSGGGPGSGSIDLGESFTVVGYARDMRPLVPGDINNDEDFDRGVVAAYMDVLFDDTKARLLRDDELPAGQDPIEYVPLYELDPAGANNRPGIINEIGAAYDSSNEEPPAGTGRVDVFVVRMRATATGSLQFVADPAEPAAGQGGDRTAILVFDRSDNVDNVVPDNQVFLTPSPVVTIGAGAGEGEYTNAVNRLDVNGDSYVTALDALIVINELNSHGPRNLSTLWNAAAGLRPTNFVDVNLDGYSTALDALHIINWLNANPILPSSGAGEGEGDNQAEGESVSSSPLAPVAGNLLAASASGAEGEADDSSLLVSCPMPKVAASATSSSNDDVAPPSYSSFDSTVIELLFAQDEDEIVTGSNSSAHKSSEASDEADAGL